MRLIDTVIGTVDCANQNSRLQETGNQRFTTYQHMNTERKGFSDAQLAASPNEWNLRDYTPIFSIVDYVRNNLSNYPWITNATNPPQKHVASEIDI